MKWRSVEKVLGFTKECISTKYKQIFWEEFGEAVPELTKCFYFVDSKKWTQSNTSIQNMETIFVIKNNNTTYKRKLNIGFKLLWACVTFTQIFLFNCSFNCNLFVNRTNVQCVCLLFIDIPSKIQSDTQVIENLKSNDSNLWIFFERYRIFSLVPVVCAYCLAAMNARMCLAIIWGEWCWK